MTAFAAAMDAIFEDPDMALDALYQPSGGGGGETVRVIRSSPDEMTGFNTGRFVTDAVTIDVRVSEVADLNDGDTFEFSGEVYRVQGEPRRDGDRLIWRAEARAL